tara:strand:+ start:35 stop:883 length:849 start_codon:yes stop_codon:yes gene_type:complete
LFCFFPIFSIFSCFIGTNGGGGILGGTRSSLNIKGTAFLRNRAPNGYGGGICATHTKKPVANEVVNLTAYDGDYERCFEVEASLFSHNTAGQGGSIYWTFTTFDDTAIFVPGGLGTEFRKHSMCTLRHNEPGDSDGLATNTVYTELNSWIPPEDVQSITDLASSGSTGGLNADGERLETSTTRSGIQLSAISSTGSPTVMAQDFYHRRSTLDYTTQCDLRTRVLNQLTDVEKNAFPLVRENAIVDNGAEIQASAGYIVFDQVALRADIGASYYLLFQCTAGT